MITEAKANRDGIAHVVSKMKWYSSLSTLLLEEISDQEKRFAELREQLAIQILDLYKTLLKYIIMSVCACYRNPLLQHLRNAVKVDGWNGSLDEINTVENYVTEAAKAYNVREANSYLKLIFNMHLSTAQSDIMQKLYVPDMTVDTESLQTRKDHLLEDSYKWILDNKEYQDFTDWYHGNAKRLLWVKGNPGKGKTMLLIGIIRKLTAQLETHFDEPYLSYFFCQGTHASLNTATAVLRGLIWMLLRQEKSLIRHLSDFKDFGSKLFEDGSAFYNLKKILQNMLKDGVLRRAYLVIDALDECKDEKEGGQPGLSQLLQLISDISEANDKVKWLVSSRNISDIETSLEENKARTRLSLELNSMSVGTAVEAYINHKMTGLAERYRKKYAAQKNPGFHEKLREVQDDVAKELRQKADGTFLWVALVFKRIEQCDAGEVLERVREIPSGLNKIYDQMIDKTIERNDGYSEHCKRMLLAVINTYRPLHISELVTLAELPELAAHHDIVRSCGLLTITEDDSIVYFVHQSAKDYLTTRAEPEIFPRGLAEGHRMIISRSLQAMSTTLRRDIYDLRDPGCLIDEVKPVDQDPLASIRYICVYWIEHLCEIERTLHDQVGLCDNGTIHLFLKKHFLHWLEALSLMRNMSSGVIGMRKLENLLAVSIGFLTVTDVSLN